MRVETYNNLFELFFYVTIAQLIIIFYRLWPKRRKKMDNARITVMDANKKTTAMSLNIAELSAVNFDAVVAQVATLEATIDAILVGSCIKHSVSHDDLSAFDLNNADGLRGTKAVVRWFSENEGDGQYGSNEIGGIDYKQFTPIGGRLLLQGTKYDAIKSAFDAVALTENGNAVAVYEIECVSRGL